MTTTAPTLPELIRLAAEADGATRISLRDSIAAYGEAAIEPMTSWLAQPKLGAFAVRVLGAIARQGSASTDRVLTAVGAAAVHPGTAAIRRDAEALVDELRERRAAQVAVARRAAASAAAAARQGDHDQRVQAARPWLLNQFRTLGKSPPLPRDATLLIDYLDQLDVVRMSGGFDPMSSAERRAASVSWVRNRTRTFLEQRTSVCWRCGGDVFSDLNPSCPACGWIVCPCGACRDPKHRKGYCQRMTRAEAAIRRR